MMKKSSTFIEDPERQLSNGTIIFCECGWKGPITETPQLRLPRRNGELVSIAYLCRRCLTSEGDVIILIQDDYDPPIILADQANDDPGRNNPNV